MQFVYETVEFLFNYILCNVVGVLLGYKGALKL